MRVDFVDNNCNFCPLRTNELLLNFFASLVYFLFFTAQKWGGGGGGGIKKKNQPLLLRGSCNEEVSEKVRENWKLDG